MSRTIVVTLALLCAVTATAQTRVPAGSRDNTLLITLENSSTWSDAESLTVRVVRHPPGVTFRPSERRVSRVLHGHSSDVLFSFDVSRDARIDQNDTLEFQVAGPHGVLWQKTTICTFTGPATFRLEQNYPNPFNPSSTVRYAIPQPARVAFTVHDVLGRRVALLDEGMKQAGIFEVEIFTAGLPSGVYFYTMEAGSFAATRKMMVVR